MFPDGQGGWLEDAHLQDFLQESIGYSLTTSVDYQIMFFMVGQGANGKGVLMHAITSITGNAAIPIDLGSLRSTNTYQLALAAGKRVIYCAEAEAHANMISDGIIKALVAGDPLMVRQIKEKPFELRSVAKVWWSMNRLPDVKDTTHGFWRRVRVVPFNRTFSKQEIDPQLKDKLTDELPGIFNWAMSGLRRLERNEAFTTSSQVDDWTENYRNENNPLQNFIDEHCQVSPLYTVTINPLYKAYKQWALDNGYRPMNTKQIKQELENLGFYKQYSQRRGGPWLGLRMNPTSPFIP